MAKSQNAFRSISEAAEEVGVPQHVLRFWETRLDFVAPVKRAGGRRFYRREDIVMLQAVRRLLHEDGLTIKGVQRLYADHGAARFSAFADAATPYRRDDAPEAAESVSTRADMQARLAAVLEDIEAARQRLDAILTAK